MVTAGRRLTLLVIAIVTAYFGASYWAGQYEPAGDSRRSHQAATVFIGTINGFEFYDPAKTLSTMPRGCTGRNGREATAQELSQTKLDFRIDALPAGAKELSFSGFACSDEVITVVRAYSLPGNASLEVARVDAPRRLPAVASEKSLMRFMVGERRGIANGSLPPNRREELYLEDAPGYLYAASVNISHADLVKIAASVVDVR